MPLISAIPSSQVSKHEAPNTVYHSNPKLPHTPRQDNARRERARGLTDGVLIPARSRISRRRWSGCGGQARALRTPQATACPKNRSQQGCSWTPLVTATSPPSPVYSRSKIGHRTCSHGWATPPDVRRSQVALLQVASLLSQQRSQSPCALESTMLSVAVLPATAASEVCNVLQTRRLVSLVIVGTNASRR